MTELELFEAALERSPTDRAPFLDEACAGNQPLHQRLEALLARHDKAASFLEAPAAELHATVDQPNRERPGNIIAGRYKLLEQIGEGGMGTVWVAEQTEPVKRRVALKLIKPGMDSRQVLSRFEAERQALALMDHPNIAKVFDGGMTEEGRPFFVMEYVKGMPITEYCDHVRLSIADRLKLFVPVCQAVQHAHHKGIIHRDLKPSNILICLYDGQPVPKVIDFGLAKAMHQPLTEHTLYTAHGLMVGTPLYMSPEQAEFNNLDVDTRTDIYSLGVILYELLTGTTPLQKLQFKDAAFQEILRLIKEVEPQRPSLKISTSVSLPAIAAQRSLEPGQLSRAVRGDLDWIVMKSLEKDRSRRYDTAIGLARDIERYLNDEPVEACPPSAGYRVRKFARKHRAALTTAVAFAGLLVLGAAFSAWLAVRATVAEHQARSAQGQAETDRDRAQTSERLASERLLQVTQEKERAEKAERQAEVEAAVAKAVNDFLQKDLLGQADLANQPGGASEEEAPTRDANIKVRTLLDRAAERVVGRFPDQPLVEAATRQVIGDAYFGLSEYALAQPHLEAALDIRRQHLGVEHPDTLTSQNNLGHLYMRQDQYAKAEPLYLLTLEGRQKKLGADHPDTLTSQDNLARLYHLQAQFGKAEPLLLQTLEVCQKKLGEDHAVTLASQNHLAMLYARQGRYAEAERLFVRTLAAGEDSISCWDRAAARCLWKRNDTGLCSGIFLPGTQRLFAALWTGPIVELDASSGRTLRELPNHCGSIVRLDIVADGQCMAAIDFEGACVVSEVATGAPLWSRKFPAPGATPRFSPDGSILVAADQQRRPRVLLLSAASGDLLGELTGAQAEIVGLTVTPQGAIYAWDVSGTVTVWDLVSRSLRFQFHPGKST